MGKVIWFEVMGQDAGKQQAFYSELFGWTLEPGPGWPDYGMLDVEEGSGGIAGAVGSAPEGGSWTTFFVQVDDLGEALTRASDLGAEVTTPPTPLPDGSTFARVHDPEGHVLGLIEMAA